MARIVTPAGIVDGAVVIDGARIAAVTRQLDDLPQAVEDVGEAAILPGAIDLHVHLNEPGRTHWEGIETGTRAAVAGGITTVVDMPLNCDPVTTTVAALEEKRRVAEEHHRHGRLHSDLFFHGGLVPGNLDQIELLIDAGVLAIKAFLVDSGIDGFPAVGERELRPAMEILARLGVPLLAHAEVDDKAPAVDGDSDHYATWLASRPSRFEIDAHALLLRLVRETGCRLHIVHLASADALPALEAARAEGLPVTVETCPHYLSFAAEELPDGDPRFKCAPPIRRARHREALWQALGEGTIDLVASDHSPAPPERKTGALMSAWGGIASLQVSLAATWTETKARGFGLEDLARWMSSAPAGVLGLDGPSGKATVRKGAIEAGYDADLVVFDPEATWAVRGSELEHRHPQTAYENRQLTGRVVKTFVSGDLRFPFSMK